MSAKNINTDKKQNTTSKRFTLQQEIVHSTIHGFGILFGIISIPILTALAARNANVPAIAGASIYGFTFLMLFTFFYYLPWLPASTGQKSVGDIRSHQYLFFNSRNIHTFHSHLSSEFFRLYVTDHIMEPDATWNFF